MATSLERFAQSHECATCQGNSVLTVRWHPELRAEQVWCPRCRNTERFTSRLSTTERWRRGEPVSIAVANKLERKYGGIPLDNTALTRIDEPTMLRRMEGARWNKDMTKEDRQALASLAVMYGLDPLMGELTLYESKPYITTAGLERKLGEHRDFDGLTDRPLTKEERTAYGISQPVACEVLIYRRGLRVPNKGIGVADPAKPLRNNPIEVREPYRMARSRAIRQAIRTFGLNISLEIAEDRGLHVDTQTGEIIEAEAREIPTEPEAPVVDVTVEPGHGGFTTDFPDDDDIGPDGTPEPTQAEIEAERRKEIKDIYAARKWIWEDFLAKFQTSYKVEFDQANLTQLDDALEKIRAALAAKKGTTAA